MSLEQNYAAIRQRLRNPPNAVVDHGIDLRRAGSPATVYVAALPVPAIPTMPTVAETCDAGCHRYFNQVWAEALHWDAVIKAAAPRDATTTISVGRILDHVSRETGLSVVDIKSTRRTANVVRPRGIAMWLARNLTGQSFPEIGLRLGGKDHTTVMHAVRKIENLRKTDPNLQTTLDRLTALLSAKPAEAQT